MSDRCDGVGIIQTVRLAIVGLGFMGSVHLKALRGIPAIELTAVVSRDDAKLRGDLSRAGGNLAGSGEQFDFSTVRKYRELGEVLKDPDVDAVDLCFPTDLHEAAVLESLRAGKHVLVEKPMALSVAGCERMMEEALQAERVLMVGQVLRFFPAYKALDANLGELGETKGATFRRRCAQPTWADWQSDPSRSGGAVLDLLIHDLDFALHLFGQPYEVAATGRIQGEVDIVSAQLSYGGGFVVNVTGGWHPGKFPITMKYRVTGSAGSIEFNFNEHPPRMCRGGMVCDLPLENVDGYAEEIRYFAECVRTGSAPARCRPEESADAVRLAEMVIESRARGGERMAWKSE